jgi:hypothetical protein
MVLWIIMVTVLASRRIVAMEDWCVQSRRPSADRTSFNCVQGECLGSSRSGRQRNGEFKCRRNVRRLHGSNVPLFLSLIPHGDVCCVRSFGSRYSIGIPTAIKLIHFVGIENLFSQYSFDVKTNEMSGHNRKMITKIHNVLSSRKSFLCYDHELRR